MALKVLWLGLALVVTAGELGRMGRSVVGARRALVAHETMIRLGNSSLRFFRGRRPPLGEDFWKIVGRPPLVDPWGHPYQVESPRPGLMVWRSFGPDGVKGTADDLLVPTAYGEEPDQAGQNQLFTDPPQTESAK